MKEKTKKNQVEKAIMMDTNTEKRR
jgi:hypothetical protein